MEISIRIPVSDRDYRCVLYFGNQTEWFGNLKNKVQFKTGFLCIDNLVADNAKIIEEKIKQLLKRIQMMTYDNILIENRDIDVEKIMHQVQLKKPIICLIKNRNDIEIISENYMELLEAKGLLLQIIRSGTNRRQVRTFENSERTNQNLQSTANKN